ncbi:hypothetical protein ABPG75_005002 [Micractinium tetrahymenae]
MMAVVVAGSRPQAHTRSPEHRGSKRQAARPPKAARTVLLPAPSTAVAVPLPAAGEEPAVTEALQAALACLAPHPSTLQPANLIPALQAALGSLAPRQGSWERAVLASPLLTGLLSLSTELLEQPAAAALGPEAPLLALEVLSHMAPAGAADPACRQAQHARMLWRRAHAALGDTADGAGVWRLERPQLMSPDMIVRYYEAVARAPYGFAPSKSRGLGLLLRAQLHDRCFSTSEAVRLLTAWAHLRRRMPFNPDAYMFADLATDLAAAACQLSSEQLVAVAEAAPAFQWPVYHSIPLLHAVCREAVHRSLAGGLPLPVAQRVLSASAKGAAAMRPRLGHELEEASAEWMRTAPGLRNAAVPAPPSLHVDAAPGAASVGVGVKYVTPLWARGAAVAAAAECGNELLHAALDVSYQGFELY